jgi:hypothetical protein
MVTLPGSVIPVLLRVLRASRPYGPPWRLETEVRIEVTQRHGWPV